MDSEWSRLRNLAVLGLLLMAAAGRVPYVERAPAGTLEPVVVGTLDQFPAEPSHMDIAGVPVEELGRGGATAEPAGKTAHVVAPGETLSHLAARYRVEVATIAGFNGLSDPNLIQAGQRLLIPPGDGFVYPVRPGDTLWDLSRLFGVPQQAIVEANGLRNPSFLKVGQSLVIPGSPAAVPAGGAAPGFVWPVLGRISSPFGPRGGKLHTGIDIAAPTGTAIRSAAAGTVISAGWLGAYGRTVMIRHSNGTVTLYAHASELLVKRGQPVAQGQIIARVGSSGNSTGPHLHFEVIVDDRPRNPMDYLPRR